MQDQPEIDESLIHYHQITNATVLLTSKAQSNPDIFNYSDTMDGEYMAHWIRAASK